MSLDIGKAFSEGFSRTFERNGIVLAAVFAGIAFLTTILFQTLSVGIVEAMLEFVRETSPEELGIPQEEYEMTLEELETAAAGVREQMPLAQPFSATAAAAGLLVLALVAEAVSIVAVRLFETDETETIPRELVTRNILLATLNGFVGGIVVWGLIVIGLAFFVLPGIFVAVVFYFLRQEIAIKDKNFLQAMADSWRVTKGNRFEVFALGLVVVLISQLEIIAGFTEILFTPAGAAVLSALLAGVLGVFGAAVVTRAYVQLDDESTAEPEPEDPYDAALSADDLER